MLKTGSLQRLSEIVMIVVVRILATVSTLFALYCFSKYLPYYGQSGHDDMLTPWAKWGILMGIFATCFSCWAFWQYEDQRDRHK